MLNSRTSAVIALVLALLIAWTGGAVVLAQGAWNAPAEAKKMKNPEKGHELGEKVAQTNCTPCHGPKGKGDGPAAVALNPKPADWTAARVQKMTDGEIFWKITNGRGPMPPWKHLSEKERWQLVNHIRQLGKK